MKIRLAEPKDCAKILDLLSQVEHIHHLGRPDIFRLGGTKFTEAELSELMCDETRPIFVAADDNDAVLGYTFCIITEIKDSTMLHDAKNLHLEDVCVDSDCRGMNVGGRLVEYVLDFARSIGCTRADLDVWEFNSDARRFYENHGFATQKRRMDITL